MGIFSKIMKLAMPSPTGPIKLTGRSKKLAPLEKAMGNITRASVGGKKGMKFGGKTHGPAGKRLNDMLKDL